MAGLYFLRFDPGGSVSAGGGVFGPAELAEGQEKAGEREADDIEVAALDAGDVAAGEALNSVSAGFVERFTGGEVAGDFVGGELGEADESGFDEVAALGVGKADEGDAGEDRVSAAGEEFEHAAGVVGGAGLAENASFEDDNGIGADDDGGTNGASGDEFRLGLGEASDEIGRRFVGDGSLIHGGGEDGEGEPGVAKNFSAARRSGTEDEPHEENPREEYYRRKRETSVLWCRRKNREG